jgi:hypothetical protein
MRPGAPELPVGIVFRRLHTDADRAILAADLLELRLDWTWFGLWDLAAQGSGLLAAAAIRATETQVVELCAWVVPPSSAVGDRLFREVTDALRAEGVEQVVVKLTHDSPGCLALEL